MQLQLLTSTTSCATQRTTSSGLGQHATPTVRRTRSLINQLPKGTCGCSRSRPATLTRSWFGDACFLKCTTGGQPRPKPLIQTSTCEGVSHALPGPNQSVVFKAIFCASTQEFMKAGDFVLLTNQAGAQLPDQLHCIPAKAGNTSDVTLEASELRPSPQASQTIFTGYEVQRSRVSKKRRLFPLCECRLCGHLLVQPGLSGLDERFFALDMACVCKNATVSSNAVG